jgi:peptide/nickel transport system permease protein
MTAVSEVVEAMGRRRRRRPSRARDLKPWYRNGALMAGSSIIGLLVLVAVFAPAIAPHDPIAQDLTNALQPPSGAHWLGTDKYGRDVLSRLIWGARVDLRVGFLAVLIPFVIGSVLGGIAGYFGGWLDTVVTGIVDVFFAFPFYVMVIALVFILGAGEASIYLAIAAVSWVSYAKIVRGEVLVAKKQDYVVAARLGGMSHARILLRHIGPNVMSQAIIYGTSDVVMDIMAIVTLGYLGLGIAPPTAEWGSMILDGQEFITTQWQQATIPGLVVVLTSLGMSWLGDGLSDLLSPERRK